MGSLQQQLDSQGSGEGSNSQRISQMEKDLESLQSSGVSSQNSQKITQMMSEITSLKQTFSSESSFSRNLVSMESQIKSLQEGGVGQNSQKISSIEKSMQSEFSSFNQELVNLKAHSDSFSSKMDRVKRRDTQIQSDIDSAFENLQAESDEIFKTKQELAENKAETRQLQSQVRGLQQIIQQLGEKHNMSISFSEE